MQHRGRWHGGKSGDGRGGRRTRDKDRNRLLESERRTRVLTLIGREKKQGWRGMNGYWEGQRWRESDVAPEDKKDGMWGEWAERSRRDFQGR